MELFRSCVRRIDQVNPSVNAVVARDDEASLAAAREAEAQVMRGASLGPLHGLPVGVKDLTETAGLRTTSARRSLPITSPVPMRRWLRPFARPVPSSWRRPTPLSSGLVPTL